MKTFSEFRLVWKDLSAQDQSKIEAIPGSLVEKNISKRDDLIFEFLDSQTGKSLEEKWEKFSQNKNPAELYKMLFQNQDAILKDKTLGQAGTVENFFFDQSAKNDPECALRIKEIRVAFLNREKKERSMAELRFDTDLQKYLDSLPNSKAWLKNPFLWFNPDKKSEENVNQRVEKVYSALFGEKGHLVEKNVFGSSAQDIETKYKRLKIWEDHLNNRQAQKLKTVEALDKMKKGGVLNEGKKFFENLVDDFQDADGFEKTFMVVSAFLAIRAIWVDYKMASDPGYRASKSTFGAFLDNVGGLLGATYLVSQGTNNRINLLDKLKLTSKLDQIEGTGMKEILKELNLKDEPDVRALLMLGGADLGKTFEMYLDRRNETDPKKQKINIRELTNNEAKATQTVTDKDAFLVAHTVFKHYGKNYFKLATGREAKNSSEEMMGARLFVEFHKFSGAGPSLGSALTREENSIRDPEKFKAHFKDYEGLILRFVETAKAIIQAPISPILSAEYILGKNVQYLANQIGLDFAWVNANIDGRLKEKLDNLYETAQPKVKGYLTDIKDFKDKEVTKFKNLDKNFKAYIIDVGERGLDVVLTVGGATIKGIYNIGAGLTEVAIEVGEHVFEKAKIYTETKGTFANQLIIQTWLPYKYNEKAKEWERISLAKGVQKTTEIFLDGAKYVLGGSGGLVQGGAEQVSMFLQDFDQTWKLKIQPKLTNCKEEIAEDYEFFKRFFQEAIGKNVQLKKGEEPTWGKDINDFFTNDKQLFQTFLRAAEVAGVGLIAKFKSGGIGLVEFIKQSAQEFENKKENIKQFNDLISNPGKEKEYFGGEIDQEKLKKLEPKVRAWMFDQLGWEHLDMSPSQVRFDPENSFIEYNEITLESILPFFGDEKCKLKINFSGNGDLKDKKRFEITNKDGKTFYFEAENFKNEILKEKMKSGLNKMTEVSTNSLEEALSLENKVISKTEISKAVAEMANSREMQDIFLPLVPIMENTNEDIGYRGSIPALWSYLFHGDGGPVKENQWSALVNYKQHEMLLFYQNLLVVKAKKKNGKIDNSEIKKIAKDFKEDYLKSVLKDGLISDSPLENIIDETRHLVWDTDSENYRSAVSQLLALGSRNESYPKALESLVDSMESINFKGRDLGKYANNLKSVALWKFAEMTAPIAGRDENTGTLWNILAGNRITEKHKGYLDYLSAQLLAQLRAFEKNGWPENVNATEVAKTFRQSLQVDSFKEFKNK